MISIGVVALVISAWEGQPSAASGINVPGLCSMVANQVPETDPSTATRFNYQTRIYRAAGVNARADSQAAIRQKVQVWWSGVESGLNCNLLSSTVNGHILKLAVDRSANEFINDAVRRWGVNLNHVDRNGGTVLDFIDQELIRAKGTPREGIIRRYQALFEANGAKRVRDLRRD